MIRDAKDKILNLFRTRSHAFKMVFDQKSPYTKTVLRDLAKFCRAHETTFKTDERFHALMEGRREVFLRITEHLNLNSEELFELHKVKQIMESKNE